MPQVVALLPALITAGTAGTEIGLQASGAFQPSTTAANNALEQKNEAALKAEQEQAFKRFAPDVQSQTGGALSDASFAQTVAELAGQPGDIGLAQQTIFGNTGLPQTQSGLASGG